MKDARLRQEETICMTEMAKQTEALYQGYWRQTWGDIVVGWQNQIRMQFEVYEKLSLEGWDHIVDLKADE